MSLTDQFCLKIEDYCKSGKYKKVPVGSEKSYKILSKESGVPVTTIQNWLNTGTEPTLSKAVAVLRAMGYDLEIKEINYN
jgi:DNA-binding phage protein